MRKLAIPRIRSLTGLKSLQIRALREIVVQLLGVLLRPRWANFASNNLPDTWDSRSYRVHTLLFLVQGSAQTQKKDDLNMYLVPRRKGTTNFLIVVSCLFEASNMNGWLSWLQVYLITSIKYSSYVSHVGNHKEGVCGIRPASTMLIGGKGSNDCQMTIYHLSPKSKEKRDDRLNPLSGEWSCL